MAATDTSAKANGKVASDLAGRHGCDARLLQLLAAGATSAQAAKDTALNNFPISHACGIAR
jgi:hypothetical protein